MTISKAEAIRKAFAALGTKAPQKDVAAYVLKHHGMKIAQSHISQQRCKLPQRVTAVPSTNGTHKPVETPVGAVKVTPAETPVEAVKVTPADDKTLEGLEAIFAIKALAKKVGGLDNLTKLIAAYKSLVTH